MENLRWLKKEGENWLVLNVRSYKDLSDDQALKVQEMQDNKHFQTLQHQSNIVQEKFNKMIVILTGFIVLFGLFEIMKFTCIVPNCNLDFWIGFFISIFLLLALTFLYISLPEQLIIKIKKLLKIKKMEEKTKTKISFWKKIWGSEDNHIFGEFLIVIAGVFGYKGIIIAMEQYLGELNWGWYVVIALLFVIIGVGFMRKK